MAEMVKSVEYLALSISGTSTTTSGMLTKGQNVANCVPFFTHKGDSANPYRHHMDTWFSTTASGSGYINFEKCDGTGGNIQLISAYVVEFDPAEVRVYQGELPTTISAATTGYSTLSGTFNSDRTAFVFYNRTGYQTSTVHSYYTLRGSIVTSSGTYGNQLSFYRPVAGNTSIYGHYFAFESLTNKFTVSHNTFSTAASAATIDVGTLDGDNAFILGSYCNGSVVAANASAQLWRAYHHFDYQVLVDCSNNSGTTYINIQVVRFINTNGKYHTPKIANWYTFTGSTTEKTSTIPVPIDLNYSVVIPATMQGVTRATTAVVNCASEFAAIWLTDSTHYKMERISASVDMYPTFYVIDWKGVEPRYYDITNNNPLASGISPVKSIEHLSASVDEFEYYVPTTSGQDMSNCVVFRSAYYNTAGDELYRKYFTSAGIRGDDIIVRRGNDVGIMYVDLEVVEFYPDQVKVQYGEFEISSGAVYASATISGVSLNKAFLIFNYVSNVSNNYVREQFIRGRFLDSTTLRFEKFATSTENFPIKGYYYVVEDLKNYWEVAHYVIGTGTSPWYSNYSTHYTPYNTMYFISNRADAAYYYTLYGTMRASYHSASAPVLVDRGSTSYAVYFDVEIIRFLDETRQHVNINDYTMNTTESEITLTYTPAFNAYEDYLSVLPGNNTGATRADSTATAATPEVFHGMRLDKENQQLVINRSGVHSVSSYGSGFVVNWAGSPAPIEDKEYLSLGSFVRTIERFVYSGTNRRRIWEFGKGQNISQCVPFISFKTGETSTAQERFFGGIWFYDNFKYFIYENFNNADDYGGIDVEVTMVEFESAQVKVQRGVEYMSNGTGTMNITIDAVNTSKAFIIAYVHARDDVGTYQSNCLVCTSFTSSTNLQLYRSQTSGTLVISWWIVECLQDQWEVTHVIKSSSSATDILFSFSGVKSSSRTVGFASYSHEATYYYMTYCSYRLFPNYDSHGIVSFSMNREGSSYNLGKANVQVIEFSENSGIKTEIVYYDFTGTEPTDDRALLSSFDINRSMIQATAIWPALFTRTAGTNSSAIAEGFVKGEFLNNNTIRLNRSGHYSVDTYGYATIIEWPMPTHEIGITVSEGASFVSRDVRLHKTDTGEILANITTSGTETTTDPMIFYTSYSGSLYAVCFDDEVGSSYNGLIYTDVFPTVISGTFPYEEGWVF